MLAGGSESVLNPVIFGGLDSLGVLYRTAGEDPARASRPFDAKRSGFVLAEGAAVLVLENLEHAMQRGAPILAGLVGYGVSSDAYHVVALEPEGRGPANAMRSAIEEAGIHSNQIGYINAHGTSTVQNDLVETKASVC